MVLDDVVISSFLSKVENMNAVDLFIRNQLINRKTPGNFARVLNYEKIDKRASCKTLEQLIPRLSARLASYAENDTFLRTAFVSVALRY